jgi:hypothetical protein
MRAEAAGIVVAAVVAVLVTACLPKASPLIAEVSDVSEGVQEVVPETGEAEGSEFVAPGGSDQFS